MRNKKILIIIGVILLAVFGRALVGLVKFSPVLFQYVFNHSIVLKKSNGNINVLLLGIGGGTHDGPDLSDTIIFTSINPDTKKVTLVSIPRDLWVPDLQAKVNTAYAVGQANGKGKGLVLAKAVVGKITGQQIDYGVRIDFAGFVKAVDLVGGLDLVVENTFDDYAYPIEGKEDDSCGSTETQIASFSAQISSGSATEFDAFPCRFKHIHFDKGLSHFSGEQALEYVRSRHALGEEGSDFARSKRQEKVISAFKDKIFSAGTLLNPVKLLSLYSTLQDSIDTDIAQDEIDDFGRLAQKMKGAKIQSAVIDYGDSSSGRPGLLIHPDDATPYAGAWVLIPRTGDSNYTEIKNYIDCEIKKGNCEVPKVPTR